MDDCHGKGVTEAKSEEHKTPLGIKLDEFGETLTVRGNTDFTFRQC